MSLCDVLSVSMGNFNSYVCDKYILVDNKIRNRKLPPECIMKYILWNRGRTTALEALYFMEEYWGEMDMDVTKQAISQRRMIIDPQAYIDINDDLIREIYKKPEELKTFKGFYLTAADGSIFDLPNYPTVREDFGIEDNIDHSKHTATARVSTMVDVLNEFIISSAISNRKYGEVKHAINHLEDAKDKIDLKKTITIYDRGYPSKDLILKTMDLNSFFVIRLKKDTFKEQREKLTTDDEIIEVAIDKDYLRRISDNEIKKLAKKQDKIKLRIITIPLSSGEIETLATNVFDKTFTIDDFKLIYNKRWGIETNYDKLKNKLQTENFSGRRKIIIEQDFYSDIYVFNIATIVKHDVNQEIEQKRRNNKKYKYKDYQANFNIAVGLVKKELLNLINTDKEKQQQTITKIIKILQKHLIPIKEETKTTNREPVDYGHKFTDNNKRSF
jgi:hypothetical protein